MTRKLASRTILICCVFMALLACAPASYHKKEIQDNAGDRVTVGTVQKEIQKGMSGSEVAIALGSPNIVSTDEKGHEIWIYDKISSDTVFSASDAGLSFFTSGSAGAKSSSQRTLTVVIKFDGNDKVRDFAYHTSRF